MALTPENYGQALSDEQMDALYNFVCAQLLPAFDVSAETARGDVELYDVLRAEMDGIARLHRSEG